MVYSGEFKAFLKVNPFVQIKYLKKPKIHEPGTKFKGYKRGDFPGGSVVESPPSNAGDVGSIPGRATKIPHAVGQLSLHATTT